MEIETLVEALNESILDAVEATDTILESQGIEVSENVTDPDAYVDVLASILDENELDEDVEEALCMSIALIESLLDESDSLMESFEGENEGALEEDEAAEEAEVDEGTMSPQDRMAALAGKGHSQRMKEFRRALDIEAPHVHHDTDSKRLVKRKASHPKDVEFDRSTKIRKGAGVSAEKARERYVGQDKEGNLLPPRQSRINPSRKYGKGAFDDKLSKQGPGKHLKALQDKLAKAQAAAADKKAASGEA